MIANDIRKFLFSDTDTLETLDWLNDSFLPEIVEHLNTTDVRRRLGIYAGERIPDNERNLTDVRNRVSLIIEYEMARVATRLMEELKINDIFWSYVVANRFPDIEARNIKGERGLRVEVKCLQTIAEEKSANFDTLLKDIHARTDYVAVFLWEWQYDPNEVTWDRAPFINRAYVFHARSLAFLRDWYWLNRPPNNLGDGLQGFDLRYAVNCRDGRYNQEEGNYGKLLRIWQEDFVYPPPPSPVLKRTIVDYCNFKGDVTSQGFNALAKYFLPGLSGDPEVHSVETTEGKTVGWQAGDICFLLGSAIGTKAQRDDLLATITTRRVILMKDKYGWVEFEINNGKAREIRRGRKPKQLIRDRA